MAPRTCGCSQRSRITGREPTPWRRQPAHPAHLAVLIAKARVPAQGIQGNEQLPGPFALSQPGGTQRHAIDQGVPMSRIPTSRIVPLFLVAVVASFPLLAQNATPIDEKQCREQFRAADLDNDGVLTASEIGSFKQKLPASLANKEVTRAEFMAVCGKKAA